MFLLTQKLYNVSELLLVRLIFVTYSYSNKISYKRKAKKLHPIWKFQVLIYLDLRAFNYRLPLKKKVKFLGNH